VVLRYIFEIYWNSWWLITVCNWYRVVNRPSVYPHSNIGSKGELRIGNSTSPSCLNEGVHKNVWIYQFTPQFLRLVNNSSVRKNGKRKEQCRVDVLAKTGMEFHTRTRRFHNHLVANICKGFMWIERCSCWIYPSRISSQQTRCVFSTTQWEISDGSFEHIFFFFLAEYHIPHVPKHPKYDHYHCDDSIRGIISI
jgi:hypothetical protein